MLKFSETTTIGNPSFEHVEITSASLKLKGGENGNTVRLSMDSSGMQIGSVSDGITLDANGNATFNGSITISPGDLPAGTVSGSAQLADAISGSANQISSSSLSPYTTQVVLDSNGMSLKSQDTTTLASFGTTVTIGENADDKSRVFIDNDSVDLIVDSNGTDTTHASFGATTTIERPTTTEHVEITSTTLKLKDGGTTRISMDSSGVQIGAVSSGITLNSSGDATFNGVLSVGLQSAISGSSNEFSASAASSIAGTTDDSASMASSVQLTSEGLNILNSSNAKISEFGANVFVGLQNAEHIKISTDGLELKDNTDVVGKFIAKGATIGKTNGAHISASTLDVSIIKDANNKSG